jgi:RHS repeat-associated protein
LIPQNINWATGNNNAGDQEPPRPALWYTAPESHAKIVMYDCTTNDLQSNAWTHPCWRVWLPSGEMLEFGATSDSVEYYLDSNSLKYLYSWKVDALVDTHGNQIHISYHQYTGNYPGTNVPYVRDAELATVSYDSPTCQNASTICPTSGSAPNLWQPLVQVVFDQATKPTRLTSADSTCQNWSNTSIRCDTAQDYSGGLAGPQVTSLGVLNDVQVQVRPSGTGGWNLLRAYVLSYEQKSQITRVDDSITGAPENAAGYLDLTQVQEFGTDWNSATNAGTSWPAMTYVYGGSARGTVNCLFPGSFPCSDTSVVQERYIDPVYTSAHAGSASQCIVWVNYGGCFTYSYSETLSQRYLVEADNGMGMQETFTWQEGHMNVVGVPSGQSVTSPFGCTNSSMNAFPCWEADEQHWSRILLIGRDAKVQRTTSGGPTITVDHHFAYTYTLTTVQSGNNWCISGVCTVVWDFGNVNDGDYLDYYNSEYRGFAQVHVLEQEIDTGGGSCTTACTIAQSDHSFITTQGWGVWNTNEVTTQQGCWNAEGSPVQYLCPTSPYWSSSNMPTGRETKVDQWASNGTTLLTETNTQYTLDCGPAGDPTTPSRFDSNWWTINPGVNNTHLLVAELDQSNPIAVCDPQVASVQTLLVDGGSLSTAPSTTVTYSYDTNQSYSGSHDYGNVTVVDTVASDGGSVGGSGHDLVQTTDYTVNDNITTSSTSATGTYIVDTAYQSATRSSSASGTIQALTQDYYDGNTSLTAAPTKGDVTQKSVAYSGTGPYNFLVTKYGYDSYGNLVGTLNPNGQTGCTVGGTSYSSCATYDTSSYASHVTLVTNALGQSMAWNLGTGISFGYGQWLQNNTDANGQVTSYQYDALARLTGITDPGEGTGLLTIQYVYSVWCQATGPSTPCSELDTIQRFDSSTTVDSRTFYDGWGKAAEMRTPADSSHDVVAYITYDAREEALFTSQKYYVSAYTGGPGGTSGTNAYSAPDNTQLGASAVYDALGRTTQTTDPAGATTTTSYLQVTGPDSAVYAGTQVVDANHHQTQTLTDALGRTRYTQTFTGTGPYTLYSTTSQAYDFLGDVVTITHPDGTHTTTETYDLAGRQTGQSDPDLGTITMQLDADGNVTQQTDARGQTVYLGYDALDRELWRNTTNSPTGAYVTYSYDGTVPTGVSCSGITPGSNAVGHVTTEQFKSGLSNSFSGAYCYGYDARGELIGQTDTLAGTTYLPVLTAYNDAGVVTQLTYPTTEYALYNFSSQERLTSITRSARGTTNLPIRLITYNGNAGPAGKPDSYVVGGSGPCSAANSSIYCVGLTYDNDLRLTHATYSHPTSSTPITYYDLGVTYDAVGNVTSVNATLPAVGSLSGGQDNQQFCYDEQNRLTWAGNTGTNPCTNQAVTGTTLTNDTYTASYTYDPSNRITASALTGTLGSSPQGSYTYDSTHYHAVDAIGSSSYEAQYDASGNMTCRTPTNANVCTSTSQTGAKFTYDVEGRLIQWVSADGATTVKYGYDGEGNRFEMQVTSAGTTTTTTYIGNLEEIQVVGGTTTKIVYFYWGGQRVAEDDNTHWYYLINDGLTTTTVVVDFSGVIAAQLFGPYGQARWSGGTMPTSYAFTGQRSDSATGLDYYGARYYDPLSGCFTSADTVLPGGGFDPAGLNRYGYVTGNPETATDPTGHDKWWLDEPPPSSSGGCRIGVEICGGSTGGGGHSGPIDTQATASCGGKAIGNAATCSSGGTEVSACAGKGHCVIIIDGGVRGGGTNGFGDDMSAWQTWIDEIYAKYGGDVGFILMETDGSDSQSGVELIHQTLQSLAAMGYGGAITLIGQSAGAASVFEYLGAQDHNTYPGDAQINSFIGIDAPVGPAAVGGNALFGLNENPPLGVPGTVAAAADYVRTHHIKGLYAWNDWDPISDNVVSAAEQLSVPWDSYHDYSYAFPFEGDPGPGNPHTYLEYNGCDYCMAYVS